MTEPHTLSTEARGRLLELLERQRAAQLAVYDAALEEAARIHGRDDAPSVENIRVQRAVVAELVIEESLNFAYMCAEITGEGLPAQPVYVPETFRSRAAHWLRMLLALCGFDVWTRPKL